MTSRPLLLAATALWLGAAAPAHAYMGPGIGMGTIGVILGVIGSILLGMFSVLWYPIKRLIRRLRKRARTPEDRG